jgi:hypothetical protein
VIVRAVVVSSRSATTRAACHSIAGVPLLPAWISVVVVPIALPESWLVIIEHREAAYPLGLFQKYTRTVFTPSGGVRRRGSSRAS